jgi:hypothetical protein
MIDDFITLMTGLLLFEPIKYSLHSGRRSLGKRADFKTSKFEKTLKNFIRLLKTP